MAASPLKLALEDLLRSRQLAAEAPLLHRGDRRLAPFAFGVASLDGLLGGGLPRGQVSEIHGPASAGRTALALGLLAEITSRGSLAAWVDPQDSLDPASALGANVDLRRLLWLRGSGAAPLRRALPAVGTLLGSGLFEIVVLDLVATSAEELRRLPAATWIRLQRLIEETPTALVLVTCQHVFRSPAGIALALGHSGARWLGAPGPGHLLRSLASEASLWGPATRRTGIERTVCR
jgi:hypothetical protein